jgi:hypothetical protein
VTCPDLLQAKNVLDIKKTVRAVGIDEVGQ